MKAEVTPPVVRTVTISMNEQEAYYLKRFLGALSTQDQDNVMGLRRSSVDMQGIYKMTDDLFEALRKIIKD